MERRVLVLVSAMALAGCDPGELFPGLAGHSSSTVTRGDGGSEGDGGLAFETDGGFAPETDGGFVPETDGGQDGARCDLDRLMRPLAGEGPPPVGWGTDAPTAGLRQLASEMVGHWRGSRTTVWDGAHPVEFAFFGDGSYSAAGLDQRLPLYYGEHCADHRTWWRLDTGDEVQAAGELRLTFDEYNTTTEEIRHVRRSGDTLSFDQWHFEAYGPIHFELTRAQ